MTRVITLDEMLPFLDSKKILKEIENGMEAIAEGSIILPPPGHLELKGGDVHIKSAAYTNGKMYVIKVASSFSGKTDGMILLFCQKTGKPLAVLLDEGLLTELRTAIAGALCFKRYAPRKIKGVGIVGTGNQAYYQLKVLRELYAPSKMMVWGRNKKRTEGFAQKHGVIAAKDLDHLTQECNVIVTTTSAESPILFSHQIQPGTHITAMGSDQPGKQELDPAILEKGRVFVDSKEQCLAFGETAHANCTPIQLMQGERESETEITIADLTGVGIQDLAIAAIIYQNIEETE